MGQLEFYSSILTNFPGWCCGAGMGYAGEILFTLSMRVREHFSPCHWRSPTSCNGSTFSSSIYCANPGWLAWEGRWDTRHTGTADLMLSQACSISAPSLPSPSFHPVPVLPGVAGIPRILTHLERLINLLVCLAFALSSNCFMMHYDHTHTFN